jgi:hypothetical protein
MVNTAWSTDSERLTLVAVKAGNGGLSRNDSSQKRPSSFASFLSAAPSGLR